MSFSTYESLYLTALLPPAEIAEKEYLLKKEISEKYGTKVSIKKPAHITIIPPLKITHEQLEKLFPVIEQVCKATVPFRINLNGIGNFAKNKVVFIHVEEYKPMETFYRNLKAELKQNTWMNDEDFRFKKLTPHMTLAYRDLTPESFSKIWNAYKDCEFKADFEVKQLHIMKHTNSRWLPHKAFDLAG